MSVCWICVSCVLNRIEKGHKIMVCVLCLLYLYFTKYVIHVVWLGVLRPNIEIKFSVYFNLYCVSKE